MIDHTKYKQRHCNATTKKGRRCGLPVENFRTAPLCHLHDPDGKFKQQVRAKGARKQKKSDTCEHTWYMREKGITCTKCKLIWEEGMK